DNTARVWSVETGQLLHTLVGHTDAVLSGAFSPDGTEVVTGSKDYTARVWDAATGALKQTLLGNHEEVIAAEFSLDGYLVGTATRHAAIKWDAYTGRMVYRLDPLTRTNNHYRTYIRVSVRHQAPSYHPLNELGPKRGGPFQSLARRLRDRHLFFQAHVHL